MSGAPAVVVVMGVSGSGKSVFGAALAASLGRGFLDADDLHPPPTRPGWLRASRSRMPTAAEAGSALRDVSARTTVAPSVG